MAGETPIRVPETRNQNSNWSRKIVDFQELRTLRARFPGSRIVHCHGVFDVLHAGHLSYFESARKFGDILVVTLTSDEFVNKGPGRPHFTVSVRAKMIAALEIVDYVAISHYPTAVPSIDALKPHFYAKGPDYRDKSSDPTGGILLEEKAANRGGGKLVFTADPMHSSSTLINKFLAPFSQEQADAVELVKAAGGMPAVEAVLDKLARCKITIVGEPIIDRYTFCVPEAISSKSPAISARYLYEESYAGGALAIANHLADFAKDVTLVTTHGLETFFKEILENKIDKRVHFAGHATPGIPTPRKTRYIGNDKAQRFFEITDIESDQWLKHSPDAFCEKMNGHVANSDAVILADFGHGLFEGAVLEQAGKFKPFVGLNVQTNSSNLGFNLFTKHKRYDYLSIDTKESRLGCHDRDSAPVELARRIHSQYRGGEIALSLTQGHSGSIFIPRQGRSEVNMPAFTDSVVDAIGAGDAFFALTAMLVHVECPDVLIPFLGNLFAGLKTKILGNKSSVSKAQLLKAASSMLK